MVFAFLVFLLPFVFLPFGPLQFEPLKVIIAEVVIWSVLFPCTRRVKEKFRSISQIFLLLIAVLAVCSILNPAFLLDPSRVFGNAYRLQGTFFFLHLLLIALLGLMINAKIPRWLPMATLFGLFVTSVLFGGNIDGRSIGPLGDPNALAASALFVFPFAFFSSGKKKRFLALFLATAIVLLSGSRSGFLGLGVEFLFLWLVMGIQWRLSLALFTALVLFFSGIGLSLFERPSIFENRVEIWRMAFDAGIARPIVGWGFGNTEDALRKTAIEHNAPIQYLVVDSTHNIFLEFWVQLGAIGLIAFTTLLLTAGKLYFERKDILQLTSLMGLIVTFSFNPLSAANLIPLWWLIGCGWRRTNQSDKIVNGSHEGIQRRRAGVAEEVNASV